MTDDVVNIVKAADLMQVTIGAIYNAIYLKKLKATKKKSWTINVSDLNEYNRLKWSRENTRFEGELIHNSESGRYSIMQAARLLEIPFQRLYYSIRRGYIMAERKGSAWVITRDELEKYKTTVYLQKCLKNG